MGIMNYWVYFNSKPVPKPADVVIFDDAHLAEQPLSSLQTLRIPDKKGARESFTVKSATSSWPIPTPMPVCVPCKTVWRHRSNGIAPARRRALSFGDWSAISAPVRDAIEASSFVEEDEVRWVWPAVRDHLNRCGVLIGSSGIEIRPYHPPTSLNPGYSKASSASTSRPRSARWTTSNVVLAAQACRVSFPIIRYRQAHRRAPFRAQSDSGPTVDDHVFGWALKQVSAAGGRAAWLCASHAESRRASGFSLTATGQAVFRLRPGDDDMVDIWSRVPTGNLVTAGRYDGLDLPGDICKLVIITTVPQASSEFERFVVAYLGDASSCAIESDSASRRRSAEPIGSLLTGPCTSDLIPTFAQDPC